MMLKLHAQPAAETVSARNANDAGQMDAVTIYLWALAVLAGLGFSVAGYLRLRHILADMERMRSDAL
jgi:hypothetical protein